MQSKLTNKPKLSWQELTHRPQNFLLHTDNTIEHKPFLFQAHFTGCMDMYSSAENVAQYLNTHEDWFCRCAQPMKVEPLDNNGYILTIGNFGSFGYEVEPKIALVLNPPVERIYTIHTIPIPNYQPPGYEVNYQAAMELIEVPTELVSTNLPKFSTPLPSLITQVIWQLDLDVTVQFPKFIYKIPASAIQATGDRLLRQIVKQISPRLTYKVQQDFHNRFDLPIPTKHGRKLEVTPK
jgi:hypothetical protein